MHQYSLYGDCIQSEVRLPTLPAGKGTPTIFVHRASLPQSTADLPDGCRELFTSESGSATIYRRDGEIYWLLDSVGSVRIINGETIEVDQAEHSRADGARQLVLGAGFRTLFFQRGNPVFHASAAGIDGEAVLFIGASGTGKSTTAAALAAAGYPVLADDVTPVWTTSNGYIVRPGPSAVRIRTQDVKDLASGKPATNNETASGREYITPPVKPQKDEYPVCRAYLLEWGSEVAIDTPPPRKAVSTVLRASHPLYTETNIPAFVDHFRRSLRFADSVDIRRLSRPKSTGHLDRIVSMIETDVDA